MKTDEQRTYQVLVSDAFNDDRLRQCANDELLFFIYLVQHPKQTCAGIFRSTLEQLAADCIRYEAPGKIAPRFTPKECQTLLAGLQRVDLVRHDGEWVWVVNMIKYKTSTQQVYVNVKRALQRCRSRVIFDGFFEKHATYGRVQFYLGGLAYGEDVPETPMAPPSVPPPTPQGDDMLIQEVSAAFEHWKEVMDEPRAILTPMRKRKILDRFRDKIIDADTHEPRSVKVEDFFTAIDACAKSPWHMGKDPKTSGIRYNSIEKYICGSAEKFYGWLVYQPPAIAATGPARQGRHVAPPAPAWEPGAEGLPQSLIPGVPAQMPLEDDGREVELD